MHNELQKQLQQLQQTSPQKEHTTQVELMKVQIENLNNLIAQHKQQTASTPQGGVPQGSVSDNSTQQSSNSIGGGENMVNNQQQQQQDPSQQNGHENDLELKAYEQIEDTKNTMTPKSFKNSLSKPSPIKTNNKAQPPSPALQNSQDRVKQEPTKAEMARRVRNESVKITYDDFVKDIILG